MGADGIDRILIVGCGDIGHRIAALAMEKGTKASGLARSDDVARRLERHGIGKKA